MLAQTIAHYRIQAKIGAGGTGEVYPATIDAMWGRDAAAYSKVHYTILGGKVIHTECRPSGEILRPFGGIAHQ